MLAGEDLMTFIISFVLKDIIEKIFAVILIAFHQPFHIGDLIEIIEIKGNVFEMSLRSTANKTTDDMDVFILKGAILKNLLKNFTISDLMLKEFLINIKFDENIEQVFPIFEKIVNGTKLVINVPKYNYFLKRIDNDLVHFTILC